MQAQSAHGAEGSRYQLEGKGDSTEREERIEGANVYGRLKYGALVSFELLGGIESTIWFESFNEKLEEEKNLNADIAELAYYYNLDIIQYSEKISADLYEKVKENVDNNKESVDKN